MSKILQNKNIKGKNVSSVPSLLDILYIENLIKKRNYFKSKAELHKTLQNNDYKIQYAIFNTVLQKLESDNKIEFNKDDSIVWIFADSPKVKKLLRESKLFKRL